MTLEVTPLEGLLLLPLAHRPLGRLGSLLACWVPAAGCLGQAKPAASQSLVGLSLGLASATVNASVVCVLCCYCSKGLEFKECGVVCTAGNAAETTHVLVRSVVLLLLVFCFYLISCLGLTSLRVLMAVASADIKYL